MMRWCACGVGTAVDFLICVQCSLLRHVTNTCSLGNVGTMNWAKLRRAYLMFGGQEIMMRCVLVLMVNRSKRLPRRGDAFIKYDY